MSSPLKAALNNCAINFDRRVNVTDLVQEYELPYEDVHKTLEEYLKQQESEGTKYLKRFLVQGIEKVNGIEIYTVVQSEKDLQEWLQRLEQSQTALYSVEIAGGAKAPAYGLKPVERHGITLQSLTVRDSKPKYGTLMTNGNGSISTAEIKEQKPLAKKPSDGLKNMFAKQTTASASTSKANSGEQSKNSATTEKKSPPVKKNTSPKTEKISPVEKKQKTNATTTDGNKKGINNFFGAATKSAPAKQERVKEEPKSNSPQKRHETPKKAEEKSKASKKATKTESPSQSDESEEEMEIGTLEQPEIEKPDWRKRCRIIDTDDEDEDKQPPQKVEKKDSPQKIEEVVTVEDEDIQPKSETYLDEDGFVITIKPKKTNAGKSVSKRPTKTTSPRKTPKKEESKKSQTSSKAAAAGAKTKQGNIMSFFSKK